MTREFRSRIRLGILFSASLGKGGAMIIKVKAQSKVTREIVVQVIISNQQLLEKLDSTLILVFAEEAILPF